ncbi:hypothetical protein F7725_023550 [Dissostichus mawsoni]|uniref:Uncharacterized protein n=1 Tax=Dissostichus mawsoni TaxID=36200 RepID=A0A7J5XYH0_DISMA|nr:hypothetical protein F7725_023550 [Dissostichus mawsoni]
MSPGELPVSRRATCLQVSYLSKGELPVSWRATCLQASYLSPGELPVSRRATCLQVSYLSKGELPVSWRATCLQVSYLSPGELPVSRNTFICSEVRVSLQEQPSSVLRSESLYRNTFICSESLSTGTPSSVLRSESLYRNTSSVLKSESLYRNTFICSEASYLSPGELPVSRRATCLQVSYLHTLEQLQKSIETFEKLQSQLIAPFRGPADQHVSDETLHASELEGLLRRVAVELEASLKVSVTQYILIGEYLGELDGKDLLVLQVHEEAVHQQLVRFSLFSTRHCKLTCCLTDDTVFVFSTFGSDSAIDSDHSAIDSDHSASTVTTVRYPSGYTGIHRDE